MPISFAGGATHDVELGKLANLLLARQGIVEAINSRILGRPVGERCAALRLALVLKLIAKEGQRAVNGRILRQHARLREIA